MKFVFVWSNLWSVSPRKADAIMPLVIKSTRHQDNSAPPRQRIPMSVSNPTCSRQCCQCWICPFLGPTYLDFHKSTPKESKKYSLYRFPQRWTLHLGMKQCPIESPHSAMVVREWACVIRLDACVRLIRRNIIYIYMFYLGTSQRPRPSNRPRAVSNLHRWPNGKPYIMQSKIDLWWFPTWPVSKQK